MGWLFSHRSRSDLVQALVRPEEDEDARQVVVDHCLCDDVLWSVAEVTVKPGGIHPDLAPGQSRRFIRCDLLDQYKGLWGYKGLEESMHPYYYSCPLRFLDLAPEACPAWRQGVRALHADRRERNPRGTAPA